MERLKQLLFFGALSILSLTLQAQEEGDQKVEQVNPDLFTFEMHGMIGLSAGNRFYTMNVGGPSLMLNITPDLGVGLGAFPSFFIDDGKPGGKLGISPRVDFKRFVFFTPLFIFDHTGRKVWTFGMGYKLGGYKLGK